MWAEAGQNMDTFWDLPPRHFQHVMRGVRKRLKAEHEASVTQAWQTGAFTGATQSKGGLKSLDHYLKRPPRKMTHAEMMANMEALAAMQAGKFGGN